MAFQWHRCPTHEYLGVSILAGKNFSPLCYLADGSTHAVDPSTLARAT